MVLRVVQNIDNQVLGILHLHGLVLVYRLRLQMNAHGLPQPAEPLVIVFKYHSQPLGEQLTSRDRMRSVRCDCTILLHYLCGCLDR